MIRGTFLNPHTGVLPFEMFRSFAPIFKEDLRDQAWAPLCDIYETDKEIVVKVELPEVKKEHVNLRLEHNVLTLSGDRKFEGDPERGNYHLAERHYGEFARSFSLPTIIDATKIRAEFKEGVLAVTLPKHEESTPKHINLKVN